MFWRHKFARFSCTKVTVDDKTLDIENPSSVEKDISLNPEIFITFSKQIDVEQLKSKLTISKDEPNASPMSLTITKANDFTGKLVLASGQKLEINTTHVITVTRDIKSIVQGVEYTVPNAQGFDGTRIEVRASTSQTDFSLFSFGGNNPWIWESDEKWPAIKLNFSASFSQQVQGDTPSEQPINP